MNTPTDDHLQEFRKRSDQAFLAMQVSADQGMAQFLQSYSKDTTMASFQTPAMAWGVVSSTTDSPQAASKQRTRRTETPPQAKPRLRSPQAASPAFNDFGQVGNEIKQDLTVQANEAVTEGKGFLRNIGMDLGERAKREAAALRDAARKAMQEETSLRGLKDRAHAELQAAKQRLTTELADAGADARGNLEGMAVKRLGHLQEEGFETAEAAGGLAQEKLDKILYGTPLDPR